MFDHIGSGGSDLGASKAFFLQALSPLSVGVVMEVSDAVGLGLGQKSSLFDTTESKSLPLHIAFAADSRNQVDEFYPRLSLEEAKITALLGFDLTTTPITMRPSSLGRTGTTLRLSVIARRHNRQFERKGCQRCLTCWQPTTWPSR